MNLKEYDKMLEEFSASSLDYLFGTYNRSGSAIYAVLFELENKNIINILLDRIEVIDREPTGLTESEQFIFDLIDKGKGKLKISEYNLESFGKILEKECKEKYFYLTEKEVNRINNTIMVIMLALLFILIILPTVVDKMSNIAIIVYFVVIMFLIFLSGMNYSIFEGYAFEQVRTKVGKNVVKLLRKLKRYLKKHGEEVKDNWENYKIYSTILAVENLEEVHAEYGHLIEIEIDRLKYIRK